MLCCPEDVLRSPQCRHNDDEVCARCFIPICTECGALLQSRQKIPKALCNDNYISYQHQYIVANQVTWLEATIACPIFTGLITYYIEGSGDQRGHLMQEPVGNVQRAYGVRGNCFSYKHTNIQAYSHTNIQLYKHTAIQTYRHTNIQTYKHTNIQT